MNKLVLKNRAKGGVAGSPTGTGYKAGEVALNFSATTPEFWAFDGTSWQQVNPPANVTVANIALTGTGGIGAAYTAFTPKPTATIVTATYSGSAYIKTGAGGSNSDWAEMGSSTPFAISSDLTTGTDLTKAVNSGALAGASLSVPTGTAGAATTSDNGKWVRLGTNGKIAANFIPDVAKATSGEIVAGAEDAKFITPLQLKSASRVTGSGPAGAAAAADSGYLVALDGSGKISSNLLPATPVTVKGAHDFVAAPPANFTSGLAAGAFYFASTTGTVAAGYPGAATKHVTTGDMVLWDGAAWHVIADAADTSGHLPLAGGAMTSKSSKISWPAPTAATPETYLDLSGGVLDGAVISCGTY